VIAKVKTWKRERDYGFLTDPFGKDYFVHRKQVEGRVDLHFGQTVEFDVFIGDGSKAPAAQNVRVVPAGASA
jgi:cold shock CspA family protein